MKHRRQDPHRLTDGMKARLSELDALMKHKQPKSPVPAATMTIGRIFPPPRTAAQNPQGNPPMTDRAAAIREEMAGSVRALGGGAEVLAKAANARAARLTGLTVATIESLRWRRLKRVPADAADAVREAMARMAERRERAARHEAMLLRAEVEAFAHMDRGAAHPARASRDAAGAPRGSVALD
jgi:hypothetical protein